MLYIHSLETKLIYHYKQKDIIQLVSMSTSSHRDFKNSNKLLITEMASLK